MATGMLHLHRLVVVLFILIYLIKTILLLSDKDELLEKFRIKIKLFEIIVSVLFLATGIFLLINSGNINSYSVVKLSCVFLSIPLAVMGFKQKNKLLVTASFVLLVLSYMLAYKAKAAKAGGAIVAINGKEIFEQKCALCHGNDGKLGMSGAKDITQTQLSHQNILALITNGKNTMPAFKSALNAEQIEAVINYVETDLKGK